MAAQWSSSYIVLAASDLYTAFPRRPDEEDILTTHNEQLELRKKVVIFTRPEELYHNSRDFELGTFQTPLLFSSTKKQSSRWNTVAVVPASFHLRTTSSSICCTIAVEDSVRREMVVLSSRPVPPCPWPHLFPLAIQVLRKP